MLELSTKEGVIQYVKVGQVVCKRYVGRFTVVALQELANTGLWYTFVEGMPYVLRGEGPTPQMAVRDSINRMSEYRRLLDCAIDMLQRVTDKF